MRPLALVRRNGFTGQKLSSAGDGFELAPFRPNSALTAMLERERVAKNIHKTLWCPRTFVGSCGR